MQKIYLGILFVFLSFGIVAQNYTVSGYIKDQGSGESLIGANVFIEGSYRGTVSNKYGFYSLTIPQGTKKLRFSFVGYQTVFKEFELKKDLILDVELESSIDIKGVTITAEKRTDEVESTRMSTINVPIKTIKSLPAIMGEVDVIKAIQLLPGVQSGMEGAGGLYVRGGGPDQNLILLDGVPVYNANHLFGFFSVFNADAINNIELIKGGFPARYGGRLSSVLDISMKEGNMNKFHGEGSIGIIASKLTLEGPIIKGKTSFIVSARRTYLDMIAQPLIRLSQGDDYGTTTGYYFYDVNAKVNHIISPKDRVYLSFYSGKDEFYSKQAPYQYLYEGVIYEDQASNELGWGNQTATARWNHQFSNKLFSNVTLTYSDYHYRVEDYRESIEQNDTATLQDIYSLKFNSGIRDYGGRIDFDYMPSPNHYVRFGGGNTYHTFKPGASVYRTQNDNVTGIDSTTGAVDVMAHELFIYAEDDYRISKKMKVNVGAHYSGFAVGGEYYHSLQPRISARYLLTKNMSVKASFTSMQQYIHLLTNSNIGLPTDLWVPATENVLPQNALQGAVGVSTALPLGLNLTVEAYYKKMNNVIEYKDGASFMNTSGNWEDKVESGVGEAYGLEVFFEKRVGLVHGWIGYTLARSERTFENINDGEPFPYKYDRTHDVSVVVNYKIDDKWDFSGTWVYGTGNALTLPIVQYLPSIGENNWWNPPIEAYDRKNSFRMAAYHRMDLGFRRTTKKKWGELTWNFGVYNAYNRRNPFYYYIGYDSRGNKAITRVSIFPFLPSIALNFKF